MNKDRWVWGDSNQEGTRGDTEPCPQPSHSGELFFPPAFPLLHCHCYSPGHCLHSSQRMHSPDWLMERPRPLLPAWKGPVWSSSSHPFHPFPQPHWPSVRSTCQILAPSRSSRLLFPYLKCLPSHYAALDSPTHRGSAHMSFSSPAPSLTLSQCVCLSPAFVFLYGSAINLLYHTCIILLIYSFCLFSPDHNRFQGEDIACLVNHLETPDTISKTMVRSVMAHSHRNTSQMSTGMKSLMFIKSLASDRDYSTYLLLPAK